MTIDEAWNNKQLQQAPAMTYAQSFRIDAIFHSIDPRCHKLCLTALAMAKTAVRLALSPTFTHWVIDFGESSQLLDDRFPQLPGARHSFCTGKPKIRCYRKRSGILIQALGSATRGIGGCIGTTLTDALFGKPKHSLEILSEQDITMPEGKYPAHVKRERRTWKRPRGFTPLVREYWDVDVESGIPVPGKGENSWDRDDDAIFASSFSVNNAEARTWPANA